MQSIYKSKKKINDTIIDDNAKYGGLEKYTVLYVMINAIVCLSVRKCRWYQVIKKGGEDIRNIDTVQLGFWLRLFSLEFDIREYISFKSIKYIMNRG